MSELVLEKPINLNENDGLCIFAHEKMGRLACMQNEKAIYAFEEFIRKVRPLNVLEIGTALGGLTCVLRHFLNVYIPESRLLSLDILERAWFNDLKTHNIDIRVENIFHDNYTRVEQYIIDFIQSPGPTAVICDGGSKKDEFNILSNYLKPGDFIFAHDYAIDLNHFDNKIKDKIWNWCEILEGDIKDSVQKNNLNEYDQELFNNVVWTCKRKND